MQGDDVKPAAAEAPVTAAPEPSPYPGSALSAQTVSNVPPIQTFPPIAGPRLPAVSAQNAITAPVPTAPPPADPVPSAAPEPQWPSFAPYLTRPTLTTTIDAEPVQPVSSVPPPATSDTVRVALLLPLSGGNARLGQAMLDAAQMALFAFADSRFELLPHDTRGSPDGAMTAATMAIGDGAQIILGPLLATSVQAVAPLAQAANVPVIGFSNDRTIAGNGIYTMGFLPMAQVERVVSYAFSRGVSRFAALVPDNSYGETTVTALQQTAARLGAVVTRVQFYDPYAQDFTESVRILADYDERRGALIAQRKELAERDDEISRQALRRLEKLQTLGDLPFEALLLPDGGERLLSVAALLPFFDIDPAKVRMLGTSQWDVPGLGSEPALIGGWFAAPPPKARKDFEAKFKGMYGKRPPRLVTLAYDATALAAMMARTGSGPDFSPGALTNPSGFWGRDGIFRFVSAGIAERGLAVMQMDRRNAQVLSPAPEAFQAASN